MIVRRHFGSLAAAVPGRIVFILGKFRFVHCWRLNPSYGSLCRIFMTLERRLSYGSSEKLIWYGSCIMCDASLSLGCAWSRVSSCSCWICASLGSGDMVRGVGAWRAADLPRGDLGPGVSVGGDFS